MYESVWTAGHSPRLQLDDIFSGDTPDTRHLHSLGQRSPTHSGAWVHSNMILGIPHESRPRRTEESVPSDDKHPLYQWLHLGARARIRLSGQMTSVGSLPAMRYCCDAPLGEVLAQNPHSGD